ncbi:hypothetical protein YC2023_108717 [Brassica napus]
MVSLARDTIDMCLGVGFDSLSKLVTHDSFDMQVTSRWETFTLGREGTALASGYVYLGGWPKDVLGCPWLSVCVRVCQLAHTGRPWLSITTHINTLVLGLSMLALPADCSGNFGPRGLSVQYTQDVRGCPSAHTGRPCVSVSTHMTSVAVRVYPCVFVSPHRTSVAVHQDTYQHVVHTVGHPRTSVAVRVCPCVSICVPQHTQDVHGCPSVHISARWSLNSARWPFPWTVWVILANVVCQFSTHRTSVGVRQHTQDVRGCLWLSVSTHMTSVAVCVCPSAHIGHPWVSVSTHRTSVCVRQHTQDVRGCPCVSVCVRQHTHDVCGFPSYTQDVCECPPAHTGRPWQFVSTHRTSVAVCVCPCVSVSTHRTSVAVRVCPSAHTGRLWLSISTHTSTLVLGLSTLVLPVDCSGHFGPRGLSVQYTQDVRGCPSAHTGRLRVSVSTHRTSVAICVCPSAHTGRPWLSISTHICTLVLGLSTLTLHVDCSGDFGPRGLSVQYTHDVRGSPSAHTGRPRVSVSTHRTSVAVRVCPCVSVSTHRTSVAVHQYAYQHVGPWT